jgi:endonuclease-8
MFSVVTSIWFRPWQVRDAGSLRVIGPETSIDDWRVWTEHTRAFSGIGAQQGWTPARLGGQLIHLDLLHTHMRMNGSWHLYRPGERWQRPARDMRLLVATADFVAVGFNVPIAEFLSTRDVRRHPALAALGPDLLDPRFDRGEALRRARRHAHDAIGDVLLNQRVVSGIGNVLKSETLFVSGVDPFTPAGALPDAALARVIDVARELLAANVLDRSRTLSPAIGRPTTRSLDPNANLWVYGRGGKPCRKRGAPIQARKTGVDARLTYWCGNCQTNVSRVG